MRESKELVMTEERDTNYIELCLKCTVKKNLERANTANKRLLDTLKKLRAKLAAYELDEDASNE